MTSLPKIEVHWIDVSSNLASGQAPVCLYPRPILNDAPVAWTGRSQRARTGEFWSPQSALLEETVGWSLCKQGEHVRVPIFAYRTRAYAHAAILGLGIELGLTALASLQQRTPTAPQQLVLFLGHTCTPLAQEQAFRCYAGLAFRTA